jgi:AmmeMemoRadiSam system protein B
MSPRSPVRPAAVAGSWYPGTAAAIAREVDGYLGAAPPSAPAGRLVGLIAPHAGLRYSGPVAAHAYGLLRGAAGLTAVLVGPSHRAAFPGCAVWAAGAFETPLGPVPIDAELAALLLDEGDGVVEDPRPHRGEHSLEMQLPFLKHVLSDVRIVPVLMGSQRRDEVDALAARLASALAGRPQALLVASSDLSHYHPAAIANRLDALVVGDVERFDPDALMARLERSHEHACGGGPIVAVMRAARALGATRTRVLRYADSGDAGERDKSRVVGYLAAALTAAS